MAPRITHFAPFRCIREIRLKLERITVYLVRVLGHMKTDDISRREFLKAVAATGCMVSAPFSALAKPEKHAVQPNIILIMADDFGYESIGANGGTSYKTPVLDGLARSGMRFEHCYSQPVCTPSRVQIMTGMYNVRNYVRFTLLDPAATTFGNLFRDAGYATCVIGKWPPQRLGRCG